MSDACHRLPLVEKPAVILAPHQYSRQLLETVIALN